MQTISDLEYSSPAGTGPLHLDVHLPDSRQEPVPVIVWLPGGGWRNCNKANAPVWLTDHGFAVAGVNYRVSGEAIAPANIHDCKAAVRWLRGQASRFGLDQERFGVAGSSAGGHLAALLGVTAGVPALEGDGGSAEFSSSVRAICDSCGPTDLTRCAISEVRSKFEVVYGVTEQYLGGPVEERIELAKLLSPLTYVSAEVPPSLILHGSDDPTVPVEESKIFHSALSAAGADSTLHVVQGGGHGTQWDIVRPLVVKFFERTLGSLCQSY